MKPLEQIDRTAALIPKEIGQWYHSKGRFVFYEIYFSTIHNFLRIRIEGLLYR